MEITNKDLLLYPEIKQCGDTFKCQREADGVQEKGKGKGGLLIMCGLDTIARRDQTITKIRVGEWVDPRYPNAHLFHTKGAHIATNKADVQWRQEGREKQSAVRAHVAHQSENKRRQAYNLRPSTEPDTSQKTLGKIADCLAREKGTVCEIKKGDAVIRQRQCEEMDRQECSRE